jgi:hypothetical protein
MSKLKTIIPFLSAAMMSSDFVPYGCSKPRPKNTKKDKATLKRRKANKLARKQRRK